MYLVKKSHSDKTLYWWAWLLVIIALVMTGVIYRSRAHQIELIFEKPINLPISLKNFPLQVGNWVGTDLPIPTATKEYMEKNFEVQYYLYP